jgi:LysR family cyn operon transcriptional activator
LLKSGLGLRRLTDEILKHYSIHPDIVIETQNVESALRFANCGLGVTFVPECVVPSLKNDQIKPNLYTLGNPIYKNTVVICYKQGEMLSAPAQAFLTMAKEKFNQY